MIICDSPIMCGTSLLHQNELALPVGLNEFFVFFWQDHLAQMMELLGKMPRKVSHHMTGNDTCWLGIHLNVCMFLS